MASLEKLVDANVEAFTQLYSVPGVDYMFNTARMQRRVRFKLDPTEVNERYFTQERELYHLNGLFGPEVFYGQQVRIAAAVVRALQESCFPSNNRFGILVEVNDGHTIPSKRLERVAGIRKSGKGVSADLRWQSLVDIVLTHPASLISAHRINTGLDNAVSNLHDWLADRLYSGDEGETHSFPYNTFHDPRTNKLVAIKGPTEVAPPPLITREHFTRVRHAKRIGFVYTDPRVKRISAVEKLVDKALLADGVFNPEDIEDKGGILLVAIGDRPLRDRLMYRVVDLLEKYPYKAGPIIEDHKVDDDRGQSPKVEFKRVKLPVEGVEPIEFIFKTLAEHREQEDEIGEIDPESDTLTGQGRKPYRQRRSGRLLRVIYPPTVYKKDKDFDLDQAVREGSKEIARDVMGRGLVEGKGTKNGHTNGRVLSFSKVFVS